LHFCLKKRRIWEGNKCLLSSPIIMYFNTLFSLANYNQYSKKIISESVQYCLTLLCYVIMPNIIMQWYCPKSERSWTYFTFSCRKLKYFVELIFFLITVPTALCNFNRFPIKVKYDLTISWSKRDIKSVRIKMKLTNKSSRWFD